MEISLAAFIQYVRGAVECGAPPSDLAMNASGSSAAFVMLIAARAPA